MKRCLFVTFCHLGYFFSVSRRVRKHGRGRTGGWVHMGESNSGGLLHKDFGTKTQNHADREVHPARHFFSVFLYPLVAFLLFLFFSSFLAGREAPGDSSPLPLKLSFVLEKKACSLSLIHFPPPFFPLLSTGTSSRTTWAAIDGMKEGHGRGEGGGTGFQDN